MTACSVCYEQADYTPSQADVRGDFCGDTPATPVNFNCVDPGTTDTCSSTPWGVTQPENYMGYADDACYDLFTANQMARMHCWVDDSLTGWLAVRRIDPLSQADDTGTPRIDSITLEFDDDVFDWLGGTPGTDDFSIACTNGNGFLSNPCPGVDSVSVIGGTVTINLDGVIPYGEWTKLTAELEDASGVEFTYMAYIANLPCDVNQDGTVNVKDATAFGDELNGLKRPELVDTNRSGVVNISDATEFGDLWNGNGSYETWNGVSLPAQP